MLATRLTKAILLYSKDCMQFLLYSTHQSVAIWPSHGRRHRGAGRLKSAISAFCYFLVFFSDAPLVEETNSAIFRCFLLIFGLFFPCLPLGKFSANALGPSPPPLKSICCLALLKTNNEHV